MRVTPACPVCNQKLGSHHTAACHYWGQVLPSECPGYIESILKELYGQVKK